MWNIATSSPAANSVGWAKKLRANTSRARCRALSGNRSRSRNCAALSPSYAAKVAGKSTSSSSIAAGTSTAARSRRRERRALGDEGGQVERRRTRDAGEGVRVPVRQHQRIVGQRHQAVQRRVDPAEQAAQVVVLAEEGVEAAAHGHLVAAMVDRPGADPAAELLVGLDQDHRDAALGQAHGGGDAGDAAAGDQHRVVGSGLSPFDRLREHRLSWVADGAGVPAGPPRAAHSGGTDLGLRARKVCRMPRCQPGTVRTSTSTNPAP